MSLVTKFQFERDHQARSLVWSGDAVIDVVGGGASITLEGTTSPPKVNWAYTFDRGLVAPSGRFQVLWTALGTKGLVVAASSLVVREINRSFYCAHAYEFPVTAGTLFDGREVLVHCPDGYNQLTVETLSEGERLCSATDKASDVFHSRIQLSPGGHYVLSAGWIWHPLGVASVFDLREALRDGAHLDSHGVFPMQAVDAEVEAACWLDAESLVVSTNPEEEALDGDGDGLSPGQIGVWSFRENAWVSRGAIDAHTGTMHPIGAAVLCLFGHPKLIDPLTAEVIDEWPDLATGRQNSSIIRELDELIPPCAVDAEHRRFAVALGNELSVIELDR